MHHIHISSDHSLQRSLGHAEQAPVALTSCCPPCIATASVEVNKLPFGRIFLNLMMKSEFHSAHGQSAQLQQAWKTPIATVIAFFKCSDNTSVPPKKKQAGAIHGIWRVGVPDFACLQGMACCPHFWNRKSFCKPEVFSMLELTYRRKDLIFGLVIHSTITIQLVPTLHQGFASNG